VVFRSVGAHGVDIYGCLVRLVLYVSCRPIASAQRGHSALMLEVVDVEVSTPSACRRTGRTEPGERTPVNKCVNHAALCAGDQVLHRTRQIQTKARQPSQITHWSSSMSTYNMLPSATNRTLHTTDHHASQSSAEALSFSMARCAAS